MSALTPAHRVCLLPRAGVLKSWQGHDPAGPNRLRVVTSVAFSPDGRILPDGRTLASGSLDQTARLWDVATGRKRVSLPPAQYGVQMVAVSPDGQTLAVAGTGSEIRPWDVPGTAAIGGCQISLPAGFTPRVPRTLAAQTRA